MIRTNRASNLKRERICLYFGSFNPMHKGHLALAIYALRQKCIDQVWMVLSPQNPQKHEQDQLPYRLRRELICSSIEGIEGLRLEQIETSLPKPHYTIRSIQALRCLYPQYEFSLLIGEDNLHTFTTWHDHKRILEVVSLFVYPRIPRLNVGVSENIVEDVVEPFVYWGDAPSIDISSTQIREALRSGKRLEGSLPREEQWDLLERWRAERRLP